MVRPGLRLLSLLPLFVSLEAAAADSPPPPTNVTLKDHRFTPAEIHIAAGKPAILNVVNQDATAEEFEVVQLSIEKIVPGGDTVPVRIRALSPGRYGFQGEFHPDTAQGFLVAE